MAEILQIPVADQSVSYRAAGRGPLVVLLHCSSSHSGQWAPLVEALCGSFRVLAPDLHGYGHSDPLPRDGRPYFEHDLAIVTSLLDRYGAPAHLVGHSLGGTVALHAAVKTPEQVSGLCVIEPVQFSLLEETGAPEAAEFHQIAATTQAMVHLGRLRDAARLFVDFWVSDGAFEAMDEATQGYVVQTIDRVMDDWAGAGCHAPGQITRAQLGDIRVPCRVVRGARTRSSARAITDMLRQTIPGAELAEVPGESHMGAARHPEAFNPILTEFLNAR